MVVNCVEDVAPPVPADIKLRWDYELEKLVVTWNFPPNSQRDVKQFQVFRRGSIQEPYELLKVYNFNDAQLQNEYTVHYSEDGIDPNVVDDVGNPILIYIDDDFTKSSKYMYTICCVDAHGLTSNYGAHYQASFDIFKNQIDIELVSHSGAPKAYPNLYLEKDLFIDSMKVANTPKNQMKLIFNPEFYSLIHPGKQAEQMISTTKENGSYMIQFINVDRQQMDKLKIEISDQRVSAKKLARLKR